MGACVDDGGGDGSEFTRWGGSVLAMVNDEV